MPADSPAVLAVVTTVALLPVVVVPQPVRVSAPFCSTTLPENSHDPALSRGEPPKDIVPVPFPALMSIALMRVVLITLVGSGASTSNDTFGFKVSSFHRVGLKTWRAGMNALFSATVTLAARKKVFPASEPLVTYTRVP